VQYQLAQDQLPGGQHLRALHWVSVRKRQRPTESLSRHDRKSRIRSRSGETQRWRSGNGLSRTFRQRSAQL